MTSRERSVGSPPRRVAAINVDIDGLHLYHRIHGLPEPAQGQGVYETGVRRFLELFRRLGLRATFFAVGEDLEVASNGPVIEALLADGHELASHSYTHPYQLVQLPPPALLGELERAEVAIARWTGAPPVGFRAPGYNTSPALFEALAARGYAYDSSILPCPAYVAAKAAAIAVYRLRGRRSASILSDWTAAFATAAPHRRRGSGMLELPISVLSPARFPFIGTALVAAGEPGFEWLRPLVDRLDFVNLELHAIDLCDVREGELDPALARQPEQRLPLARRGRLFERWFRHLRDGWENVTLAEAARRLHPGDP